MSPCLLSLARRRFVQVRVDIQRAPVHSEILTIKGYGRTVVKGDIYPHNVAFNGSRALITIASSPLA
jgi:hypothetical protein